MEGLIVIGIVMGWVFVFGLCHAAKNGDRHLEEMHEQEWREWIRGVD